jgi:putative membrane protein
LKLPKTIARKEILQAQYKIMTYRLWYIITWPSAILASIFAYGCFFTDLGKAWLQMPWMHVNLFVFALYLYHGANKFSINCKTTK